MGIRVCELACAERRGSHFYQNTPRFSCARKPGRKRLEVLKPTGISLLPKHSKVFLRTEARPQTLGGFTSHQDVEMKKEKIAKKEKGKN